MTAKDALDRVVRISLQASEKINKVFVKVTACLQVLVLPQLSKYQRKGYYIYALQFFSNDLMLIACAKTLATYYYATNFQLLLSLGSVVPFCFIVVKTRMLIPCPPAVEVVSTLAISFAGFVLVSLGYGTFEGDVWMVYTFAMVIWPWLVMASMVSRLYIERTAGQSPFSPIRDLPFIGTLSAAAYVLMLQAVKSLTITDAIALTFLDPVISAIVGSVMMGSARRKLHFKYVKIYVILVVLMILYSSGDQPAGTQQSATPAPNSDDNGGGSAAPYYQFLIARFLLALRSFFVKWSYSRFYMATAPTRPPETELIFFNSQAPKKNRFKKFPAPTLFTLDAVFDSGLRDVEFHGMGPLGTLDLQSLTEMAYMLPVASVFAWIQEVDTIPNGLFSADKYQNAESAADIVKAGTYVDSPTYQEAQEGQGGSDQWTAILIIVVFCLARILGPYATSRALFDRASPPSGWKHAPLVIAIPFFFFDVLYINIELSKFQIVVFILLAIVFGHHRDLLWNTFKRRYLLLSTQELQYYQPSCCRQLQRRTLLEFLHASSTDDYGQLLLETAIKHGANMRELARDCNIKVWDPTPSATAAWKLAVSLVTKSLKRNMLKRKQKEELRADVHAWLGNMVIDLVEKAVDIAAGHGSRLRHAGALADMFSKRRAIRLLHNLARRRRLLRLQRQKGQLASVPMLLGTTGGVLRSVHELNPSPPPAGFPTLPPPPRPKGGVGITSAPLGTQVERTAPHMSLTRGGGSEAGEASVPGSLAGAESPTNDHSPIDLEDGLNTTGDLSNFGIQRKKAPPRGVWGMAAAVAEIDGSGPAVAPGGTVVIAFGDSKRGQLGLNAEAARKHIASGTPCTVVEELRGYDPVQVATGGVASFVVGARGHLWAFGSNRSEELGSRKEVSQVSNAQRVKSVRDHHLVQIASSPSASGQAVTLALTRDGHVLTFGCSTRGALGQGPDVEHTQPLLLRLTLESPVRLVVCGAHHSVIVTDEGRTFTFGDNRQGQLGIGNMKMECSNTPMPLDVWRKKDGPVRLVVAGDNHNLAVTEEGKLYSWGANANGQLGLGRLGDMGEPQLVRELQDHIISIAAGARHSVCVAQRGMQVWSWGSNVQGQLGLGRENVMDGQQRNKPSLVQALSGKRSAIVQVAAAACHSLALTRVGEVYSFGDNSHGQLGFVPEGRGGVAATRAAREIDAPRHGAEGVGMLFTPKHVVGLSRWRICAISTAEMHSLALAL